MDVVQQDLYMFFFSLSFKISRDFLKILNYISFLFQNKQRKESKVNENVEAEKMYFCLSCNHDFIPQEN